MIFHNKLLIFFAIIFSLLIIILIISKIECGQYIFNTFDINNAKNNDKLKLTFISDFHNKYYKNDYKDLIDDIIKEKADYIIFGGDFINYSKLQKLKGVVEHENTAKFIKALSDKINSLKANGDYNFKGFYFGFGNHEMRLAGDDNTKLNYSINDFKKFLNDNNINIVDNNSFKLAKGINISGLSLYDGYYSKGFSKRHEHIEKEILDDYFNDIDIKDFNIMLFHKPGYAEDFINYGYDLVLSGHNHGGLINFPFLGPIISSDLDIFPKYAKGYYKYKDGNVIVSAGLGEHTISIRVNNKPEIVVININ